MAPAKKRRKTKAAAATESADNVATATESADNVAAATESADSVAAVEVYLFFSYFLTHPQQVLDWFMF